MNELTTVPIMWLFVVAAGLGTVIISGFIWWLRREFSRLDGQHSELKVGLTGVHKRVDWLIVKLLPGEPYPAKEDENG